jgi:hypothetical protein
MYSLVTPAPVGPLFSSSLPQMSHAIIEDNDTSHDLSDSSSSDEENEGPKPLRGLLYNSLVKSRFDKTPHMFAPEGILEELITEETIRSYLCIAEPKEQELIDFVRFRARKVFATMVYVWYTADTSVKALKWLNSRRRDDTHFPIVRQSDWKKPWFQGEFYEAHWKFFAPIFSTDYYNDLEETHILPFISETTNGGEGSFGVVTRYTIHKHHLRPVRYVLHSKHSKVNDL